MISGQLFYSDISQTFYVPPKVTIHVKSMYELPFFSLLPATIFTEPYHHPFTISICTSSSWKKYFLPYPSPKKLIKATTYPKYNTPRLLKHLQTDQRTFLCTACSALSDWRKWRKEVVYEIGVHPWVRLMHFVPKRSLSWVRKDCEVSNEILCKVLWKPPRMQSAFLCIISIKVNPNLGIFPHFPHNFHMIWKVMVTWVLHNGYKRLYFQSNTNKVQAMEPSQKLQKSSSQYGPSVSALHTGTLQFW